MLGRRSLIVLGGHFALGGVAFVLGCDRAAALPKSCEDVTALSDDERAARSALAYADRTTKPDRACSSCVQWGAPNGAGACGGCKLLKGPIHPQGTCKAFAARS
jgi:hypothetical protein